jgi:predicted nucleotidyltransferase
VSATAVERWLPVMVDRLVREFDPLKIILFGSHARGDANEHSDVDLLVVLRHVDDPGDVMEEMLGALEDVPVPKDVIPTDLDEIDREGDLIGPLLRPALREGKVLYERG